MKIKNKKTGEIVEGTDILALMATGDDLSLPIYRSLAELNEEWEDIPEEPKRHWIIDTMNDRVEDFDVPMTFNEAIGNYFDTREEAEKAVEKLKAIEKLKEYELHIEWANTPEYDEDEDRWYCSVDFSVREGCNGDILFNLLFGGEE